MRWTSILAIFWLFWVMSAFIMLPLGLKTRDEVDEEIEHVPGQAESAPINFRPGQVALRATVLALILCALFVANYSKGWVSPDDLNVFGKGPTDTSSD